jgi:hypothetical protein
MRNNRIRPVNENLGSKNRRLSILESSYPNSDALPIDCVLVYSLTDQKHDHKSNGVHHHGWHMGPSERRETFEAYLVKKQGLILRRVVCRND